MKQELNDINIDKIFKDYINKPKENNETNENNNRYYIVIQNGIIN